MKKRFMSLLLTAAMLVSMVVIPAGAASETLTLKVDTVTAAAGEEVAVNVSISGMSTPIGSFGFRLDYDPAKLEPLNADAPTAANPAWAGVVPIGVDKGTYINVGYIANAGSFSGNGAIATFKFKVKDGIGYDPIALTAAFTEVNMPDFSQSTAGQVVVNGAIEIERPASYLDELTISGSGTVAVPTSGSTTVTLTAQGIDQYDAPFPLSKVTWSITGATTGITIKNGVVTVTNKASAGTVTVTAVSGGKEATFNLNITKEAPKADTVTVTGPKTGTVGVGANAEFTFTAKVTDQFGVQMADPNLSWSADAEGAEVVSIVDGKLTVKAGSAAGSVTVTATCGGKTGSATITISREGAALKIITISGDASVNVPTAAQGSASVTLTAEGKDQYGNPAALSKLTWSIPKTTGVTIDKNGVVTVTNTAAAGTVTVTAVSGGVEGTFNLTINKAAAKAETVTVTGPKTGTIGISANAEFDFTAQVKDQFGDVVTNPAISWSADYDNFEYVSITNGKLIIKAGFAPGTITVTATCGGKTGSATITISRESAALQTITISGDSSVNVPTAAEGSASITLTAEGKDQYGDPAALSKLTWSIPKTTGVTIDKNGVVTVTKNAVAGTVTVTAVSGGVEGTFNLTINKAAAKAETVTVTGPTSGEIAADTDGVFTYTASVVDQYGAKIVSPVLNWDAESDTVQIVSMADGKLTVKAASPAGSVTITATCGGKTSAPITLNLTRAGAAITKVDVSPSTANLTLPAIGGDDVHAQFSASAEDNYGTKYNNVSPEWKLIDAPYGVEIDNDGKLTVTEDAVACTFQVTATYSGKTSAPVSVTIAKADPVATSISFGMESTTLTVPTAGGINGGTYCADVRDQYGLSMDDAQITYSFAALDGADSKVSASGCDIEVLPGAVAGRRYTLTASYAGLSAVLTITVVDIDVTFSVTAADTAVYGTPWNKIVTKVTGSAILDGESVKGTFSVENGSDIPAVGEQTYTVKFTSTELGDNGEPLYTVTETGSVEITAKPLTLTWTAPKSITYTGEAPAISAAVKSGVVSGDTVNVTLSALESDAGSYTATASIDNDNYTLTNPSLAYEIKQAKATLDIDDQTICAGNTSADLAAQIGAVLAQGVNGEEISGVLTVVDDISSKKPAAKAVKVNVSFAHDDDNYVSPVTGSVMVTFTNGKAQTITFTDKTVTYGGSPFAHTATVTVGGSGEITYVSSNPAVATVTADGTVTVVAVGTAKITATVAADPAGDWAATPASCVITVEPKEVTLTGVAADNKVFDGTTDAKIGSFGSVTGVITGDDVAINTQKMTAKFADASAANGKTVTFSNLVLIGADAKNYVLASDTVTATANITPAPATVVLSTKSQTVGKVTGATATVYAEGCNTAIEVPVIVEYEVDGEWTTEVPTKAGTYNVRAYIDASRYEGTDLALKSEGDEGYYTTGSLKIVKKSSGSSSAVTPVKPVTPVTPVTPVVPVEPETDIFADVVKGEWYYDAVMAAVENGLFSGVSDDRFAPNMGMDRAMMVTVLAAMEFGVKGAPKAESPFTDLTADWYKNAVAWAAENKITYGVSDTQFAPHMALTREQVAVFLYAYAQYKGYDVSVGKDTNILSYNDAFEMSAWAYPAMQWACGAGLIDGTPEGYLLPNTVANRAQVAVILNNFDKLFNG